MNNFQLHRSSNNKTKRPERVLLICYFDPHGIATIPENLRYLQSFSTLSIDIYNVYGKLGSKKSKQSLKLKNYDVIIFHNTVTYDIDSMSKIEDIFDQRFREYGGLKVLFKQDEQFRAHSVAEYIRNNQVDLIFSCLPEPEYRKVYPEEITGKVRFAKMLTGYVTPEMKHYTFRQSDNRPIDVGYRGSLQPIYFGKLAYEKQQIGYDFLEAASKSRLVLDISSEWKDRKTGKEWIKFLSSCKSTLGTESGASIFDLNGDVEKAYRLLIDEMGEHLHDKQWCEKVLSRLADYEGNINYNQISPRHFEAAATRTLQLLYEGDYSGILYPYKHYIPVKKDMSNFEELEAALKDDKLRKEITERAYEEIILNKNNWIESFANRVDREIVGALSDKKRRSLYGISATGTGINVLLICGHQPHLDPRIKWIAENAPDKITVHVLGLHDDAVNKAETVSITESGGLKVEVYRKGSRENWITSLDPSSKTINLGGAAISFYCQLTNTPRHLIRQYLGIDTNNPRFDRFMWTLGYFAKNSTALSYHGMRFNNIDAIIATDLDTLAAGIVLKERLNTSLIYDAHEFWPEGDPLNTSWEKNFWKSIEKTLLPSVDFAITVSPNLAQHMTSLYKHSFNAIPNAEPLISDKKYSNKVRLVSNSNDVAFIYQGNYAVGRGLRLLLDAWPSTDKHAKLFLRGMPNEYGDALEKIAESSGLLHKRIFFLDPVPEDELVASAKSADVGIIPYAPVCINHKYCCPNKLSQYCQAALPILANNTEFIADVVTRNRLGRVVDFNNRDELIRSVNYFTHEKSERLDAAYNAREFSNKYFHWGYVSQPLYKFILQTKKNKEALGSTTDHTYFTPELNLQEAASNESQFAPELNIQEAASNESQFAPELNIQEDNLRQKIESKLRQLYIDISSNPSINRTYSYRFVRYLWRLLPDSFKSRYSP